eukprot:GGOE01027520.1.p1 GENE.GGOE01027520.1~~GGOE01027520.1.p1  ORF type:complete len:496 (+),score=127.79 GGOE01027520.1:119-1606(+)
MAAVECMRHVDHVGPSASLSNAVSKVPPQIPSCMEFEAKYLTLETVGTGCYAAVKRCLQLSSSREFAVKCCAKVGMKESLLKGLQHEVAAMQALQHPHIIQLEEVFNTLDALYIVMEYVRGGTVYDLITMPFQYPEAAAAAMMRNVLLALQHMHERRIAHCDIKPENLLLEFALPYSKAELRRQPKLLSAVKIADFGFARSVGDPDDLTRCCGTPYYIAPEVLQCGYFHTGGPYGTQVDMWSLGVVGYIILTGRPPFQAAKRAELFNNIVRGKWSLPLTLDLSEAGQDFLQKLLVVDPKERYTARQALEHPWIRDAAEDIAVHVPQVPTLPHLTPARSAPPPATQGKTPDPPCIPAAPKGTRSPSCLRPSRKGDTAPLPPASQSPPPPPQKAGENAPARRRKKKLVVHREDLAMDVGNLIGILERHPSVTYLDLSQDPWSPTAAKKVLRVLANTPHIRLVEGPGGASARASELQTVDDVLALTSALSSAASPCVA